VQHIEKHKLGVVVVTRHTRWDNESATWANGIWIDGAEVEQFKAAWCRYRSELEADTLVDLSPSATDQIMALHDSTVAALWRGE
jgi:hypothetical protein